ncbi:MAG: hypothetical protein OEN01_15275, partial [Candidatus Krumholzibacteria bacterium]|nr:hypothetical protein [Candidatus Krumholzibacteria bacterium]
YLGNHVKGTIIQTGFMATAVWAIEARKQYSLADDRHVLARADLERASTVGDIESAQREARAALSTRDDKEAIRDAAFVALGSVWLLNVIDVAFAKGSSLSSRRFAFETLYQDSVLRTGMSFRF